MLATSMWPMQNCASHVVLTCSGLKKSMWCVYAEKAAGCCENPGVGSGEGSIIINSYKKAPLELLRT